MFEQFRDWVEHEAPKQSELTQLLAHAKSEIPVVAKIAQAVLFVKFFLDNLRELRTRREITGKTTDEIGYEVLKEMQFPQPVRVEQPILKEVKKEAEPVLVTEQVSEPQPPPAPPAVPEQLEIAEVFLNQMQEQTKKRDESLSEEMRRLRGQGRVVFWGLIIAAGTTLVIIVTGIILIFLEQLTVGIVAEAVGILPGIGTLTFSRLSKEAREGINRLEALGEDNLRVLQAIQATLLIPDSKERSEAIISLASKLMDRAMESA